MCLTKGQRKARDQTSHCAYCGRKLYTVKKSGDRPTVDHFYPLSSGNNLNRFWNRFTACFRCNQIKANKMPEQFVNYCRKQLTKQGHPGTYIKDLNDIIANVTAIEENIRWYYLMRDIL